MRYEEQAFEDVTASGNSNELVVKDRFDVWVQISGTFTATGVQVQGTIDGTNWFNIGSPVTAGAVVQAAITMRSIRLNISGLSAGTVSGVMAYREGRSD